MGVKEREREREKRGIEVRMTKQFCGFVVIVVVIGDGTGSFKTVNLEVFKLKKEKLFFLISITWYTDTLIPEVSYEPDFVGTRNLNLEIF